MKYLTFIRHAKSDWTNPGQTDFERGLNARGTRVAPKMGRKLKELEFHPNKIYCSSAVRTKETASLLVEQLDYPLGEVNYTKDLYEASVRTLFEFVTKLDDQFHDVAFIGHNPSMTYLAESLTQAVLDNIPTCGVVRMSFPFDEWKMVSQATGNLIYYIYPKEFDF